MALTVALQKQRDKKEQEVRMAIEHQVLMKKNFQIYKRSAMNVAKRFELWCKRKDITPTLDMQEIYKEINQ